jgi:hypothetical protein
MDWMIISGTVCLGLLIGALVGWFVNEAKEMDFKVLSSSVLVLTGGGVLALFSFLAGGKNREIWLYPVGLLFGFIAVTAIEIWFYGYDGNKRAGKSRR